MFPMWFKIVFYVVFYGVGVPFLIWAFIDTTKKMKDTLNSEEDFEEEEW